MKLLMSVCFLVGGLFASSFILAQDSIKTENLKPYSYSFDIENGVLVGEGATILKNEIAKAHTVMLGDHSRSELEAEFSNALVRLLNQNEFKTMVWEIGESSCSVVNKNSENPTQVIQNFKTINQKYFFEKQGLVYTPIPDLKSVEAARLVEYIKKENWNLLAVGTETYGSFRLLCDELYNSIPKSAKIKYKKLYADTKMLLDQLFDNFKGQNYEEVLALTAGMKSSQTFNDFIDAMDAFEENKDMVNSFRFSLDYWHMYGNKQGFRKNVLRNARNKAQLKSGLAKVDFDFNKDKIFLKMWRGHLTKGTTRNGFYGVGNTLMELTEFHGNKSLTIGVLWRYVDEEGVINDALENPENIPDHFKEFMALGQKENWTLIDLRSFNEVFYWGNYTLTLGMNSMIKRYDMILIPKIDRKVEINY